MELKPVTRKSCYRFQQPPENRGAGKAQKSRQYRVADLSKESYMIIVISNNRVMVSHRRRQKFYDHIHENSPALNQLKYGVLALGDSAYPLFCKTGEDVDKRLHQLGGRRIVPLKRCDTDFEADANDWIGELLTAALAFDSGKPAAITVKENLQRLERKHTKEL